MRRVQPAAPHGSPMSGPTPAVANPCVSAGGPWFPHDRPGRFPPASLQVPQSRNPETQFAETKFAKTKFAKAKSAKAKCAKASFAEAKFAGAKLAEAKFAKAKFVELGSRLKSSSLDGLCRSCWRGGLRPPPDPP